MAKIDWNEPREVARWAAEKVHQGVVNPDLSSNDEPTSRCLWLRYTLDGPGFMLTPANEKPRAGLWTKVAVIAYEDAIRIRQPGPRGWPALCRLSEKIEEALKGR